MDTDDLIHIKIDKAKVCIANKDGSNTKVENANLSNCEIGVAAFNKKSYYNENTLYARRKRTLTKKSPNNQKQEGTTKNRLEHKAHSWNTCLILEYDLPLKVKDGSAEETLVN